MRSRLAGVLVLAVALPPTVDAVVSAEVGHGRWLRERTEAGELSPSGALRPGSKSSTTWRHPAQFCARQSEPSTCREPVGEIVLR